MPRSGPTPTRTGIYVQRIQPNLLPIGGEVKVNDTAEVGNQISVDVSTYADGRFVVTWADATTGEIFGQRFTELGLTDGAIFRIDTGLAGSDTEPVVAVLENGNFAVAWSSSAADGQGDGIFVKVYNSSGGVVAGPVVAHDNFVGDQQKPAIADLGDNQFVVVWESDGQDGSSEGIYFPRFNYAGAEVTSAQSPGETQVNSQTAGSQSNPSVGSTTDGGYVITWQSFNQDGNLEGVFLQRYGASSALTDRDYTKVGQEIQINDATAGNQQNADVGGLVGGDFVAVWESEALTAGDILQKRFDSAGEDQAVPLDIQVALSDTDGSEIAVIEIFQVPLTSSFVTIVGGGTPTPVGTNLGGGVWEFTTAQLPNLHINPPSDSNDPFSITVTAVAIETTTPNTVAGDLEVDSADNADDVDRDLLILTDPVADPPLITTGEVTVQEDPASPIALPIEAKLSDTDGSETLSLRIDNVPTGAGVEMKLGNVIVPETAPGSGSYFVTFLGGQTEFSSASQGTYTIVNPSPTNFQVAFTPAAGPLGNFTLQPPVDFSTDAASPKDPLQLSVTAISTETANGATDQLLSSLAVNIVADADAPNLAVTPAVGSEDTLIPLSVSADTKDPNEHLQKIEISGVPGTALLNQGVVVSTQPDTTKTWEIDLDRATASNEFSNAAWTGAASVTDNTDNGPDATLTADTVTDNDNATTQSLGQTVSVADDTEWRTASIYIKKDAIDTRFPEISLTYKNGVDAPFLNLQFQTKPDPTDIDDTPRAVRSSNGNTQSAINEVGDFWQVFLKVQNNGQGNNELELTLSPSATTALGSAPDPAAQGSVVAWGAEIFEAAVTLTGLAVTPPPDSDVDFNLSVTVTSKEPTSGDTATTTNPLAVTVDAVADTPNLATAPASGNEGSNILIGDKITHSAGDADGSETVKEIKITNVPAGAALTVGTQDGGDPSLWTLTGAQIPQLATMELIPPAGFDGLINLGVTVTYTEDPATDGEPNLTNNEAAAANLAVTVLPAGINLPLITSVQGKILNGGVGEQLSTAANLGDVNGDNIDDFIIGATNATVGAIVGAGRGYLVFGQAGGFGPTFDLDQIIGTGGGLVIEHTAIGAGANLGTAVSGVGDVNNDGNNDFVISVPLGDASKGAAWLLYGPGAGGFGLPSNTLDLNALTALQGVKIIDTGGIGSPKHGSDVSLLGDVNGDNIDDLLIGMVGGAAGTGEATVIYGRDAAGGSPFGATFDVGTLRTPPAGGNPDGHIFQGEALSPADGVGSAVRYGGDVDGDGVADLVIGAPGNDPGLAGLPGLGLDNK